MTIPLNRDFNHIPNYSSLESKNNDVIIDIPNDTTPPPTTTFSPSPEAIASWQRAFSNLPSVKKNLLMLLGATGLGAGLLAAGLSKGDRDLVIAGSSACGAAFLMALSTVFPKRQPTQTMDSVIAQLHQLVDKYPDYDTITHPDFKLNFNIDLNAVFNRDIDEIPLSARGNANREILFNHCHNVFMKFTSFDNLTRLDDMENIKLIIKNVVQDFCKNAIEVDTRIEADKHSIQNTFFQDKKPIEDFQIKFDSGETHHQGRVVAFVTFNGDDKQQIVYKPRDMRIDAIIAGSNSEPEKGLFHLVNILIGNNSQIMPTYKFLSIEKDGKRYGYTEFLSHEPGDCQLTFSEMRAYYQTIGAIQAVSQLFGITDLHRQNILVHDKTPFPIDLEVSFDLQALQEGKETATGLDDAVRDHGLFTRGGGSKSTPNKVELMEENGEIVSMQEHYQKNKSYYLSDIENGFEIAKNALAKNDGENRINSFISNIPDDLQIRFVPLKTGDFIQIMEGRIDTAAYVLMRTINESCRHRPPYQILSPVNERQTLDDILHADIPRMVANMHGDVHYNGGHLLQALTGEIKPILLNRVKEAKTMTLNENFKASLDHFHQN